jgi:hypothetical protein
VKINRKEIGCAVIILATVACSVLAVGSGYVAYRVGRYAARQVLYPIALYIGEQTESISDQPTGDDFFESYGGNDFRRFALVEPYHAVSLDRKRWSIIAANGEGGPQYPMTSVDVINQQMIVFDSPNGLAVIIPSENLTLALGDMDLQAFLQERGVRQATLRDPAELMQELEDKGCLEWYPQHWCK